MNDAQRKINAIINDLPDDAQAPSLNKFSLSDLPIMTIGANGKWTKLLLRLSRQETCASTFSCAAQVNITGGQERNSSESGCSKNASLRTFYSTGTTDFILKFRFPPETSKLGNKKIRLAGNIKC
jgi:hypothetical protein